MGALEELTRPATDDDHVGGVPARLVAAPASTAEAAALVAAAHDLTVVVRGGGTKLHWGPPPRSLDLIIDTGRLAGMVEHAAGDLITVLRAGTPLDDLSLGDQQLALDAAPGATVGGVVATGASGPRRLHYGTARDLLIGITVVRPDGTVTRSGGKVVKNVAGYDLGKLYTGSYGSLGLITECVFRLHPRPAAQVYVQSRAQPVTAILEARVAPTAIEVDSASDELAVLIEGTPAGVRERAGLLSKVLGGDISDEPPPWWGQAPWAADGIGMKLSVPLSQVPELLGSGAAVRGSAGTGVLYAGASDISDVERLRALCVRAGGHAVVLTAPSSTRDIVDMWGPVPGLALMRRIKDQFDPGHRFAPGRFVGGL
ncbi:FAD-binding protein [Actinoplanes bogorensis]|uniref:FAD-binding protein n=1 Tax=Paractinoplanes bogorensis TaxID=1610840 RepID=A0ABS5YLK6_9ACTN|nr:FAD-binding protein [Actinoplanes bogorensis]MBU2664348.1 FAD-binding protein [Actinoplanes bogorensis]